MLIEILRHTPTWVFVLFVLLLAVGIGQLRDRSVPVARLFVLPGVLLALGASNTLAAVGAMPWVAPAWLLGFAGALALALRMPTRSGVRWLAGPQRIHLPGSVAPLVLLVGVFGLRYAVNVAQALQPALRTAAALVLPLAVLFGALAGFSLGRAWAIRSRVVPRAVPLATA